MKCGICLVAMKPETVVDELKHLPLYVVGSEGVLACLQCRLVLTEVARGMMHAASRSKMEAWRDATIAYKTNGETNDVQQEQPHGNG